MTTIKYYYSNRCKHCTQITPLVQSLNPKMLQVENSQLPGDIRRVPALELMRGSQRVVVFGADIIKLVREMNRPGPAPEPEVDCNVDFNNPVCLNPYKQQSASCPMRAAQEPAPRPEPVDDIPTDLKPMSLNLPRVQ